MEKNEHLAHLLGQINLGSDIAEQDILLEETRIETSVFIDLIKDRVDLVPGNKGSGKSALYRIFVEFISEHLLKERKVVVAHGVTHHGDSVFHAFKDKFEKLSEDDFINFWCIYFISLAHEQFIKNEDYADYIKNCKDEIGQFLQACNKAKIPEIEGRKSLKSILEWALNALAKFKPKLKFKPPGEVGELELDLFGQPVKHESKEIDNSNLLPIYAEEIKKHLEAILKKSNLTLWLMVDRLDEIFPRRSELEKRALRGLLRTIRIFSAPQIRVKVFLRDDMLESVVKSEEGFTALTHLTSRKADTIKWEEEQLLTLIVKRFLSNEILVKYLDADSDRVEKSFEYRKELFYKIFSVTVHRGENQSDTMRWIFNHCMDANGVVTPRDVIRLFDTARQKQYDVVNSNINGVSANIITSEAILYAHEELSKHKRMTFLEAEFPHLWCFIEKFMGSKSEYSRESMRRLLGKSWESIANDLCSIGFLHRKTKEEVYVIPFLYRRGLNITKGKA